MKACSYCTKEIEDNVVKCKHCGGWFTDDADIKQKEIDREKLMEKALQGEKDKIGDDVGEHTEYFYVPPKKMAFLCVITFGFYEMYWFYKNWKAVKTQEGKKLAPFWRAVFSVFFCFSLFKRILISAGNKGYKDMKSYLSLTGGYIVLVMLYKLPDPYWLLCNLSFIPLLYVNKAIYFNNEKLNPAFAGESKVARIEILLAVLGGILWILNILGMFFPEPPVS